MTVRSPAWQQPWSLRIPRVRLEFSRAHVLVLATSLYVVVLLLVYLHLAGQVAAVRHQINLLDKREKELLQENTWLEAEVLERLALPALAEFAAGQDAVVSRVPLPTRAKPHALRTGQMAARTQERADKEHRDRSSFLHAWARALHLEK